MLRVYHGNRLETLRDLLVEMIRRQPLADPFAREQILVQSPGMAQWLKLELAQRLGVAANLAFPLPASFLWDLFAQVLDDVPAQSAYQKSVMTWILLKHLPDYLADERCQLLRNYLQRQPDELSQYRLCNRIADLFDQYLVYRPEWIQAWETGQDAPLTEPDDPQRWQPLLWRVIVDDIRQRGLPHWHRANMHDALIAGLRTLNQTGVLPQRLFVFGISALPQSYLHVLTALGEQIDIHLMLANPCRHYWGDIIDPVYLAKLSQGWLAQGLPDARQQGYDSGHPLLASLGKQGRDYLQLIQQLELAEVGLFSEPDYSTLLAAVQADILTLQNRTEQGEVAPLTLLPEQLNIQVHTAYSPLREVEILHDQLLAIFSADPSLTPQDIIVMMPDVSTYAPAVEAVFGNAREARYLPYAISDRCADDEIALLKHFLQLVTLEQSRFSVTELLSLLELPATRRRFALQEDDLENIQHWIKGVNIHWGLDARQRAEVGAFAFADNSWQSGLDRLFSGYAIGAGQHSWQQLAPYEHLAGLSASALGQLSEFIQHCDQLRQQLSQARHLDQWQQLVSAIIADFYQPDEADQEAIALIHQALERLRQTHQLSDFQQPVAARLVQDYLHEQLTQTHISQRFLAGQINICTLMPMRAIPFKVVCLIGMNDGDYPRSIAPAAFDLINRYPCRGDRSRREDDRYLFLEALLSARDQLYISYLGRSSADNSLRIPTVLVSELLDYLDQAYRVAGNDQPLSAALTRHHPLTPYSARYYHDQLDPLFSFNPLWYVAPAPVETALVAQALPAPEQTGPIELASLLRFFRHPVQAFLQSRLQVSFAEADAPVADEEPFTLNGLARYRINQQLLTSLITQGTLDRSAAYLRHSGALPVGQAGELWLAQQIEALNGLYDRLQPLLSGTPQRREIDLIFDSGQLQGWVDNHYPAGLLRFAVGRLNGKQRIVTWIEHLVCCAAGYPGTTTYHGLDKSISFAPVCPDQARQLLEQVLATYQQGQLRPLGWVPEPAWAWLSAKDPERGLAAARTSYLSQLDNDRLQRRDPYLQRIFPHWEQVQDELIRISDQLFRPMQEALDSQ